MTNISLANFYEFRQIETSNLLGRSGLVQPAIKFFRMIFFNHLQREIEKIKKQLSRATISELRLITKGNLMMLKEIFFRSPSSLLMG
jgi:hypothetical protein